jgi:hypothetical protein
MRMRLLFAAIARIAAMISAWCAVNVPSGWRRSVSGFGTCASYVVPGKIGPCFVSVAESPNRIVVAAGSDATGMAVPP